MFVGGTQFMQIEESLAAQVEQWEAIAKSSRQYFDPVEALCEKRDNKHSLTLVLTSDGERSVEIGLRLDAV
jgi:hypothetical protein